MKKIITLFALILSYSAGFGQGQFIFGIKGGINGCIYQFNSSTANLPSNLNTATAYTRIISTGPAIPALVELIYGTKKFRIGYQFEYERILTSSYRVGVYDQSGTYGDTTVYNASITQHFFCNNILIEYIAFENHKNFRLVPDLNFGYFFGVSSATLAPYNFTALNQNRFKIGLSLNLEYYNGPYNVVFTPSYGLVPVVAAADPNEKGYMHFIGINIGFRFNVTKSRQEAEKDPRKKKKEYINPEEESN